MKARLDAGNYVFCTGKDLETIDIRDTLLIFKERQGNTMVRKKEIANQLKIAYPFIASWITLAVHSSLGAVGLTTAFYKPPAENGQSFDVTAGFYHDPIFADKKH